MVSTPVAKPQDKLSRELIAARLLVLWEQTGDTALLRISEGKQPHADEGFPSEQDYADWLSTSLMDCFKHSADAQVFAFLFELNQESFLHAIQSKVRRGSSRVDPQDVLQEVFLNIYRYPHRFHADRADAFRNWGHRIVRNTLLKFLKGQSRVNRCASLDDDAMLDQEDVRVRTPDRSATDAESAQIVDQAYLIYLTLYLMHFDQLSAKEKLALTLVEIDGSTYKSAAEVLGIRLENLKMVIFRGRRKIFRGLTRSLADLGTDLDSVTSGSTPLSESPAPR